MNQGSRTQDPGWRRGDEMQRKILSFSALLVVFCLFSPWLVSAEETDVAIIQISRSLKSGPDRIEAGAYTVRVLVTGDSKRIQLVRDNQVISDEAAIELSLKETVSKPMVAIEKMKSDDLIRIKIKMASSMFLAYYKIV